jgi:adenylosuccinate synthase
VNPEILLSEMKATGIDSKRLGIDRNAGIASFEEAEEEAKLLLRDRLGSTLSGTGVAVANRALRKPTFRLAKDIPELRPFITDVSVEVNHILDKQGRVLIEGTQGFGLSVYHAPDYPYATSRDTTASGFLSELGISPRLVTDIIMCVRSFPIRVGGNSGPLPNEIAWGDLRRLGGYPVDVREYTTTTKRLRRVAVYSDEIVKAAIRVNRPTQLALHGADYICYGDRGRTRYSELSASSRSFIERIEAAGVPITLIGTGPTNEEIIDRTRDGGRSWHAYGCVVS